MWYPVLWRREPEHGQSCVLVQQFWLGVWSQWRLCNFRRVLVRWSAFGFIRLLFDARCGAHVMKKGTCGALLGAWALHTGIMCSLSSIYVDCDTTVFCGMDGRLQLMVHGDRGAVSQL